MAWIESHQKLKDDPKILAVNATMNWSLYEGIGRLHCFWWWCVDHCEDGDLRRYNDVVIASAAGVSALEAKRFVEAMLEGCGNREAFLEREPYFRLKNWWKFIGPFLQVKYKHSAAKWQSIRDLYHKNSSLNSSENTDTQPNQTIPNQPNQKTLSEWFESLWLKYPEKDGKKAASNAFLKSVKTEKDWIDIQLALTNYLAADRVKRGFIKNGSTWFNNWRDWVPQAIPTNGQKKPSLEAILNNLNKDQYAPKS